MWALRATDEPPEEWLGAAVARRGHGAWTPDAPEWLEPLDETIERLGQVLSLMIRRKTRADARRLAAELEGR